MPISSLRPHRETAGMHSIRSIARARPDETVAAVIGRLRGEKPASCELICVTGEGGRLLGTVPATRLLFLDGASPMRDVMDASVPAIGMDEDQETAASLALHHGVDALPVVDRNRVLMGVMPAQALLHVLRREHVEDLHRLTGIRRETEQARHAIEDPPLRRARHRLPWLLIGLVGGALATAAMAGFHDTLERTLAAAFFVPGLVYLADAIGTQSEAVAVRGLSLTRAGIGSVIGGELRNRHANGRSARARGVSPGPRRIRRRGAGRGGLDVHSGCRERGECHRHRASLASRAAWRGSGLRQRAARHGNPGHPDDRRVFRRPALLWHVIEAIRAALADGASSTMAAAIPAPRRRPQSL